VLRTQLDERARVVEIVVVRRRRGRDETREDLREKREKTRCQRE
jgi:hypothetical protein